MKILFYMNYSTGSVVTEPKALVSTVRWLRDVCTCTYLCFHVQVALHVNVTLEPVYPQSAIKPLLDVSVNLLYMAADVKG